LETLLSLGDRESGVAFWLIAAGRRVDFRPRMAQTATGDKPYNMGEFGLAAACLGWRRDAEAMVRYLRVALPRGDAEDPHTALAALLHLDNRLGAHRAGEFLIPAARRLVAGRVERRP
jgi:hypothetical protein